MSLKLKRKLRWGEEIGFLTDQIVSGFTGENCNEASWCGDLGQGIMEKSTQAQRAQIDKVETASLIQATD